MPASNLARMAQRACMKNMRMINDLGDAPYDIIKPLLSAMDPEQLHEHEKTSPHIVGADAEIWRAFVRRDIENWQKYLLEPKDPHKWYRVYRKLVKEQEFRIAKDEEMLKATMDGIKSEKALHTSRKIELDIVKPPTGTLVSKEVIRVTGDDRRRLKDRKYGKYFKPDVLQLEREGRLKGEYRDEKHREDQVRTPKTNSKLAQIRKETMAISRFHRPATGLTITNPLHGQVTAAPRAFIDQYRRQSPPKPIDTSVRTPERFNPRKRPIEHVQPEEDPDALDQREKRLNAAKTTAAMRGSSSTLPSVIKGPNQSTESRVSNSISRGNPASTLSTSSQPSATMSSKASPALDVCLSPRRQVSRVTSPSPPDEKKPMMRIKKAPVNIFMAPKKQRVN